MNVTFELGISLGEISKVRFEDTGVPKLDDPFTWFIRRAGEAVTIHAHYEGSVREIGRASWVRGRLIERVGVKRAFPNDHQWKMVGTALGRVCRREKPEGAAPWRRLPRMVIGPIVVGVLAIVATAIIFVVRTDPPGRATIVPYYNLLWSDVERGGETTAALMTKDPQRERGRKLCVTGTVVEIEGATVDARRVHTGRLRTPEGDVVPFIAVGSTRSIVARYAGRFCGFAHGKQIIGLFDLPENRSPERDR
ncbi:MAG: hypothetical protein M4D80_37855 [Myxococcota bacterium]|nr:hypothetical protein [Myxococcota bacterium]